MKNISLPVMGAILLQLIAVTVRAEDSKQDRANKPGARIAGDAEVPIAVVLSIRGNCEYSSDGVHFTDFDSKHVFRQGEPARQGGNFIAQTKPQFELKQGMLIRTGANSRVDVFFRGIGTTMRMQADTEVKIEKMSRTTTNNNPVLETLVDLRKGRIFTVVRSLVEGSTFEIRNAARRSVVEGAATGGMGRYIITADGTQVADSSSVLPLKLVGGSGITIIAPGQQFDAKEGKTLPLATPKGTLALIEFDELHALAEAASKP